MIVELIMIQGLSKELKMVEIFVLRVIWKQRRLVMLAKVKVFLFLRFGYGQERENFLLVL